MNRPLSGRRLLAALLILALAPPARAAAAEWSAEGFFSQRFDAVGNRGFEGNGFFGEAALDSVTDLGVTFSAATPRATFSISPGVRALISTAESVDAGTFAPRLTASALLRGPRSQTTASLSIIPSFVSGASVDDPTLTVIDGELVEVVDTVEEEAVRILGRAQLRHEVSLTPRDTVSAGVFARGTEYLGSVSDALSPTRAVGVDGSWSRALTPRTSVSVSPSFQQFFDSGAGSSGGQSFSLLGSAEHLFSERFSATAGLGPSFTRSEEEGFDLGLVGNLGANYRTPRTRYAASISQTVGQDEDGSVETFVTARASASRAINATSRFTLTATAGFENPLISQGENDRARVFSLSPAYTHELTPDWSLGAGARLSLRDDEEGLGANPSLFLQITRGFEILP